MSSPPAPATSNPPAGAPPSPGVLRRSFAPLVLLITLLYGSSGCHTLDRCAGKSVAPGQSLSCPVPEHTDRAFELELPASWDGVAPLPVLIAFHGGGGNRHGALRVSCPGGNTDDPGCLSAQARARGLAVVRPDGTGSRPLRNIRTWNAGGGRDGLNCTSGPACKSGVDDLAYFDDLLAELGRTIPVDGKRIFLTGLSNGGAISHRIACERPDRVAAIAAVGGANQFAAAGGACPGGVAVLQVHGTEDPCWTFPQTDRSCLESDNAGIKVGALESTEGWRARNGCDPTPIETPLPDTNPADGTRTTRSSWSNCTAAVELLRVDGGGHTWPNGFPYFGEDRVGRVPRDFGSEILLDFLLAHPRP